MKYQIKKRFTGEIIYEDEAKSFKDFVEKNKTNLSNADLSYADLSNANLSNADLSNSNLFNAKIKNTKKEDLLKALKIKSDNMCSIACWQSFIEKIKDKYK